MEITHITTEPMVRYPDCYVVLQRSIQGNTESVAVLPFEPVNGVLLTDNLQRLEAYV